MGFGYDSELDGFVIFIFLLQLLVMRTIKDIDYKDKRVLLRVDLNSTVINGVVQDNPRIKAHAETIKQMKGAKLIVLAHQGRPGKDDFLSLEQHLKLLEKHVGRKITFVKDLRGLAEVTQEMKTGDIILLDNIRKYKDEFSNDTETELVKTLSANADVYVNDAFSVCHREQASVTVLPTIMEKAAGPNLVKELDALKQIKQPAAPVVYVLAGAKPEDAVKLIRSEKADNVLVGGAIGELFVRAKGVDFGAKNKWLDNLMMPEIRQLKERVMTPIDFATEIGNVSLLELPVKEETCDIGEKTIAEFKGVIKTAGTVVANGTLGVCEKGFTKGSVEIYKTILESDAYSLVCGGDTTEFLEEQELTGFSHVSLAGGAMLQALVEEKLPGVEVLKT
jgi:phosphoglycerate kinase